MPGFPVLHHLPELAQPHVHWIGDATHPTNSFPVAPFSSCLQSFPASGSFQMSQFFASGGQHCCNTWPIHWSSIAASASVLPMNIQSWFPLRLTGWISLQSKEVSTMFSSTTVQKHQFFGTQPSLWSNSHIHTWYWEDHSFDYSALCW